jgi:hypothetical protein
MAIRLQQQRLRRRRQDGVPGSPAALAMALCTLALTAPVHPLAALRQPFWQITYYLTSPILCGSNQADLVLPKLTMTSCWCVSQGMAAAAAEPVILQVVLTGAPDGSLSTAFIQRKSGVPVGGPLPALYASQQLLNVQPYVSGTHIHTTLRNSNH